jgi:hypothetical protein
MFNTNASNILNEVFAIPKNIIEINPLCRYFINVSKFIVK